MISNEEINTLNNSTLTTTLQEQIDWNYYQISEIIYGIANNIVSNQINCTTLYTDTINTSTITNDEFNSLNGINTTITIQEQLNDLVESGGNGIIDYITTKSVYINQNLIDLNPLVLSDGIITYFKISNSGSVYATNLYINNILIDFNYFLKSETWSRSDILNITDNLTTDIENECHGYTDDKIATVNTSIGLLTTGLGVNTVAIGGLATSLLTVQGEILTLQTELGVLESQVLTNEGILSTHTAQINALNTELDSVVVDVETLQGDVGTIQEKVFYETSGGDVNGNFTRFNSNLYINNGITDIIKLKTSGEILGTTITCGTGNLDVIAGCINAQITNGHISFIDNCNTASITTGTITNMNSTNLTSTSGTINNFTSSTANINNLIFSSGLIVKTCRHITLRMFNPRKTPRCFLFIFHTK